VAGARQSVLPAQWARGLVRGLGRHWEVAPIAALALAVALVYLYSASELALPFDDSYISLQFARNLADHGFLTFDGENASAGATSLLHVVLLAVPIKLGVDPVRTSVGLGLLLHVALVAAVYWLGWTVFRDRLAASIAAVSVAAIGYLALDALNGMETTLFLLLSTLAAAAFLRASNERAYLVAGALAALAVMTRPEGVLLLAALVAYYAADPKRGEALVSTEAARRLAALAAPSALVLAGLAIFYWVTTDALTPGTATAKLYFFREFEVSLNGRYNLAQAAVGNFVAPLLPWLVLAAFGVRRREALLFAIFWVGFIVLYYMLFPGGLGHYWYRYQHIFLPALAVFAGGGLASLLRGRAWRPWDVAFAGIIGVVLLAAVAFQVETFRNHYAFEIDLNLGRQIAIAQELQAISSPGETIAAHDIGAMGFFSEREVIDLVGLVNPDAVDYHEGRRLREYVDRVRPNYIVILDSWWPLLQLGLEDDPETFEELFVSQTGRDGLFKVYRTHY